MMNTMHSTPPLYDRRRLEKLVMEHRMRVHLARKKAGHNAPGHPGVKASR